MRDAQRGRKARPWQVGLLDTPEKAQGLPSPQNIQSQGVRFQRIENRTSRLRCLYTHRLTCVPHSPVTLELCSWKRGDPSQPQGEGSHEGPPSGARTLYSCSATRCGLVRASPSPHWGCLRLQGACQPQKSPHEGLPIRKQPSSFLGTSKNLAGKQRVPGGDAEGGACTGTPEHPMQTECRIETALGQ